MPSSAAALLSGGITDRRSPRSSLGVWHGGELYSICPPGSKVSVPPDASWNEGVPFDVLVSTQP